MNDKKQMIMKTRNAKNIAMLLVVLFMASGMELLAQRGMHHNCIPDLTDEQKEKIDELRIPHMKNMQELRADVKVYKAELGKLMQAEKPDMGAINSKIDEISKVKSDIMKEHAKHKQDVRALLTDEQRIYFDRKMNMHHEHRNCMHMKHGMQMKNKMMKQHRYMKGNCQGNQIPE